MSHPASHSPTIRSKQHHQPPPSPGPMSPSGNPVEEVVIGEWRREQVLGSGAFGVIVLWKNNVTGNKIAVKQCRWINTAGYGHGTIDASNTVSRQQKDRWNQEVELMRRLDHPNVVKSVPIPAGLDSRIPDLPCLGMEYCDGGDLRKRLSRAEFCNGLPESSVRRMLDQLSGALLYLHSLRIIHRDLKPENVVLKSRPDGTHDYKLIDLGYCKELDQNSLASSFVGTLQYLAPELFTEKSYSPSVDNWSFGLLIHEVLTGRRPFLPNSTPAQWLPVIKNKRSEDIVAYYNESGGVVYEKEISSLTHVSSVLKSDMERFLRTVLEYDPKRRGGKEAFLHLHSLLTKPVINVFDMNRLQVFTYDITSGMSMQDLKSLIQSTTGYNKVDQILLIPSEHGSRSLLFSGSETLIDNELVWKFLNMMPLSSSSSPTTTTSATSPTIPTPGSSKPYDNKCIYLFDRSHPLSFAQYSVTSIIPPSVEKVLLSPTKLVSFEDQRMTWSHFLWVAQTILTKYNHLVQGHQAFLYHVMQLRESVRQKGNEVIRCTGRLSARMEVMREEAEVFARSTCKVSSEKSKVLAKLFDLGEAKDYVAEVKKLDDSYAARIRRLESMSTRVVNVTFDPHRITDCDCIFSQCYRDKSRMYQVYTSMITLYDDMRKRSKEEKNRLTKAAGSTNAFDNTPMVKLLCDLFQLIERMIRDNYANLTTLLEISSGFNSTGKEFTRIASNCRKTEIALRQVHSSFLTTVLSNITSQVNGSTPSLSSSSSSVQDPDAQTDATPDDGPLQNATLEKGMMSLSVSSGIGSSLISNGSSTFSPSTDNDVSPSSDWTLIPSIK